MPTFLLSYRYAKDVVPGDPAAIADWRAFFAGMADNVVDAGNPTFTRADVGECGSATTVLGGYSFIKADDLEQAITLAEGCPAIAKGGGVQVGEITLVNAESAIAGA